ncbi:MAG TPA: group III truncated hemoglobin [Ferrovibrio sp.]|uniref:group III truncated hemoglobin n=1 Tax=Ferrovibrio sp. TaxID=1917215 RepID=UPI002B4AD66B|nr:group III truncated hemoglobin [Ferrovibrio sp.]HLT77979.1 group III truncated hemoglobin [Ferrovibrio sp.]
MHCPILIGMSHDDETTYAERQRRRAALSPGAEAGVTEEMIHAVVHGFYGRIRQDALLGPIFNGVIGDNWDHHLAKMCDFWSSVLLMSGRYDGRPMPAHVKIDLGRGAGLDDRHFDHWLAMFRATVRELCPPAAAALFEDRAQRIAASLLQGVRFARGEMPDWLGPVRSEAPAQ